MFLLKRRNDRLDTARGIINGLIVGLVMWAFIIGVILVIAEVIR